MQGKRSEDLTGEAWEVALEVCTPGQIEALKLREAGLGYKRIAVILGLQWETVRDRIKRAEATVLREMQSRAES